MVRDEVLGTCSSCLLTPPAEKLLARLAADLRAKRGDDGSWGSHGCPACGRVTVIWDGLEGWSFGDSGWSFEPDGDRALRGTAEPPASPSAGTPEWLTLGEAAFLADVPVGSVAKWLEAGRLEHLSLPGEDRLGVLVRVDDVMTASVDDPPPKIHSDRIAPRGRRDRRRPSEGLGGVTGILVGALGLLFLAAFWWTGRGSAPSGRESPAGAPATHAVAPRSGSDEDDPEGAATSEAIGEASPTTAKGVTSAGGRAMPMPGILFEPVAFVSDGTWVSAAVRVSNTTERWLPASEVTFLVLDASGSTLGSDSGYVDLGPGEDQVVVADGIELPSQAGEVSTVRADLLGPPLRDREEASGSLAVADASVRGSVVRGRVVNTGSTLGSVHVYCALYRSGGKLSGVGIALVGPMGENHVATFQIPVDHVVKPVGTPVCSAT